MHHVITSCDMSCDLPRVIPSSRQQILVIMCELNISHMSRVSKVLLMGSLGCVRVCVCVCVCVCMCVCVCVCVCARVFK